MWKRHCFAWEYKGKHADLDAAFNQLRRYALALENPPLLIVCDMARFRIRTNWTDSVSATHAFALEDLAEASVRAKLKWAMADPERLRPGESRQALTERTLTAFYNARPQWIADAQTAIDAAVAAAYGWDAAIADEVALRELPALDTAGGGE